VLSIENNWQKCLVKSSFTIEQAIQVLNETSLRIVLVADTDRVLVGTVSDGDIRRGLLEGKKLSDAISKVMNRNPLYVMNDVSRKNILRMMSMKKVLQIPIVNEGRQIIGLHLWDELLSRTELPNSFVIMAGGKGTRLLPKTKDTPKPMLKLYGKPILEHIIVQAREEGFRKFYIAVNHLREVIEQHFGNGEFLGVSIEYLRESIPLGTAGALSLIDPLPSQPIVVCNGDVLTEVRYADVLSFHNENDAVATMAVKFHDWQNPFGVVQTNGLDIIGYEEKPFFRSLINGGVYVLDPSSLTTLKSTIACNMPELFESMMKKGSKVIAYPIHEPWSDIGSHEDFNRVSYDQEKTKLENDRND